MCSRMRKLAAFKCPTKNMACMSQLKQEEGVRQNTEVWQPNGGTNMKTY